MSHDRKLVEDARRLYQKRRTGSGGPVAHVAQGPEALAIEPGFWDVANMVEVEYWDYDDYGFTDDKGEVWLHDEWDDHVAYGENDAENDITDQISESGEA